MSEREYPCEFCDTSKPLETRYVTLTMKRNDRWFIFDHVPALVCPNCGHRYFDGPMLLKLEEMTTHDQPEGGQPVQAWLVSLPESA